MILNQCIGELEKTLFAHHNKPTFGHIQQSVSIESWSYSAQKDLAILVHEENRKDEVEEVRKWTSQRG